MRNDFRCAMVPLLTAAICATSASVLAVPLSTGETLFPSPGEPDPAGGTIVASAVEVPLLADTFTGSLTTTVIAGDNSNPLGGLTFTYLLTNNADSANVISQLTVPDFAGFLVDASYQALGDGTPPTLIARSSTGDAISFGFLADVGPGPLGPGSNSTLLVLQTNAPNFRSTAASAIDGSIGRAASFAPVVAADFNHDGSVDADDLAVFSACATGPGVPYDPAHLPADCTPWPDAQGKIAADFDTDGDVDQLDFAVFQRCLSGGDQPADPGGAQ